MSWAPGPLWALGLEWAGQGCPVLETDMVGLCDSGAGAGIGQGLWVLQAPLHLSCGHGLGLVQSTDPGAGTRHGARLPGAGGLPLVVRLASWSCVALGLSWVLRLEGAPCARPSAPPALAPAPRAAALPGFEKNGGLERFPRHPVTDRRDLPQLTPLPRGHQRSTASTLGCRDTHRIIAQSGPALSCRYPCVRDTHGWNINPPTLSLL